MISRFNVRRYRINIKLRILCLVVAGVLLSLGSTSGAEEAQGLSAMQPRHVATACIPAEYGEVIYQKNGQYPQQIFIVGQSHRSALSGRELPETTQVQTEIYRIGEWLIREKNVGLLLPEGFFQEQSPADEEAPSPEIGRETIHLDSQTLTARLSDTRRFVNADLLLNACYNVPLAQVEDEQLYCDIRTLLSDARQDNNLPALSQLDGLQNQRTIAMLQNIPAAVEQAFQNGRTANRQAMVTIGLAHVKQIIDLLQRGSLPLSSPNVDTSVGDMTDARINLLQDGYGVTVIIPKSLAENKQLLRLSRLDIK